MTSFGSASLNLKALKSLYASDSAAKAVLDEFASRQRNQQTTKLEQLLFRLNNSGIGVAKGDVIDVLRRLDEFGCGNFRTGRKGHPTRFEWKYDLVSVGKAAAGGTQAVEEIQLPADQDNGDEEVSAKAIPEGAIQHTFQLRPDWQIELTLPSDLSSREAGRLSDFVKTLPFDAEP
jgi:hypothetical protein